MWLGIGLGMVAMLTLLCSHWFAFKVGKVTMRIISERALKQVLSEMEGSKKTSKKKIYYVRNGEEMQQLLDDLGVTEEDVPELPEKKGPRGDLQ